MIHFERKKLEIIMICPQHKITMSYDEKWDSSYHPCNTTEVLTPRIIPTHATQRPARHTPAGLAQGRTCASRLLYFTL